ncbi:hypothetical protein HPB50_026316 [Hyalomma asiaticum]|uniref:Uncharacterized protein n=1 Tax=Hyalomma asiaticum TaxID=266040 RepID=A0ACB7T5J8_HYAAI|nr:hypothetical protein HPB50_026316 [Hyalomma asiaticum]
MESAAYQASTLLEFPSSKELLARFTYYDYAVFVCMLAMSGSLGLWSAWHDSRSDAKSGISLLLNGERRLPPVPVGASLMASFISAAYLLGNAAEVYRNGTLYMMTFVSYALALAVTAHLFMPVFYRLEVMTTYEGGIKAVVLTDTFQAVVTVLAMLVVIALGMHQMGGLQAVWQTSLTGGRVQFDVIDPDPTVHYTVWGLAFGSFFTNTASYATNHMMVLRYLTVPTLSKAKFVVWFNFPLLCTVLSLSSLAGLLVYVKYSSCDPVAAHQIFTDDQMFLFDLLSLGVFFGLLTIGLVAIASRMGNVLAGAITGLVTSLVFSLWFNLGQFITSMALPRPLPSMDGCPAEVRNATSAVPVNVTGVAEEADSGLLPDIYSLSSLWYSMLAWFVLIVVAVPVSYFTSTSSSTDTMNPKLICQVGDVVFWFAPEKFRRHLRFNVGKDYVEPEKPPSTPEKRASVPQVVFDCEKKAEKKKHDSSLTAVSYIRRATSASLGVPLPPPAPRISSTTPHDFYTHM